ncbi:NAD(P)H-binding protein [Allokutzneria sp. A3M-2-11 16]|uniref:NmrA family NAD(P)-binding protein n=1 Tax=Allokutzneria sp. A3M-2-11 16 TaxID=2962043 RepID=UPI0020B86502|nr:NAD(P)H-binding protein [Allokutzneria sp. A3M-2-11 16]MCP3802915.1 NAD(P)H-binding protein [Allokutzneria sp. A3M-2-11 16]
MFVVAGANGSTGGAVARALLAEGHPVRVLLRSDRNAEQWRAAGAEVAVADVRDASSLTDAFLGAHGVYVLNPPPYTIDDMFAETRMVTAAYRGALAATGARAVVLSSIGAQLPKGTGNIFTAHIMESELAELDATFVRPGNFMTNWLGDTEALGNGVLPSFLDLDRPIPNVAPEDIAAIVVRELLSTGTRVVELAGPVDYTARQIADGFGSALGHPVKAEAIPREQWSTALRTGFGIPAAAVATWEELWDGMNSGHIRFEGTPERGRVTIEEFAARTIGRSTLTAIEPGRLDP